MAVRRLIVAAFLTLLSSCYPYEQYFFVGHVYDGAAGKTLTKYTVSLQFMTSTVTGTVDSSGYYSVGPLPPYQDFTINISAGGYRPFSAHHTMYSDPATKTQESFYYDAYLFPSSLKSPAVMFNIAESGSPNAPAGTIRLQPTAPSATYGLTPVAVTSTTDAGVPVPQVWANADDLQASTFSQGFSEGGLAVPEGALVYGVTYAVSVFGVDGYAELDTTYTAGTDGDLSLTLTPLVETPLSLVFNSGAQPNLITPDFTLTLIFNQPVALDSTIDPNSVTFVLNENFNIDSPNVDPAGDGNTLTTVPPDMMPVDFRGVEYNIANSSVVLSWNKGIGLATSDALDPINSATYAGLESFLVRPQDSSTVRSQPLTDFLGGAGSITVVGTVSQAQ